MIWHFFEVWVLMLAAFAIGCPIGALAYRLIAQSPFAELQGGLADVVGDLVDDIKRRLGIGPVWRPEHRHGIGRPMADDMEGHGGPRIERSGGPVLLPAPGGPLAIADRSAQPEMSDADDDGMDERLPAITYYELDEIDVDEEVALARPVGLASPRNGVPDDLQRIRGIGKRIEQRLNRLGIFHFGQIAAWTPAEMRWVAQQLAFPERIEWDDWIGQAVILASGGDTGFIKSADRRRRARRQRALEAEFEHAVDEAVVADYEAGEAPWDEPPDEDAEEAAFREADDAAASGEGEEPVVAEGETQDVGGGEPSGGDPEDADHREAAGDTGGDEPSAEGEAADEAAREDGDGAGAEADAEDRPA